MGLRAGRRTVHAMALALAATIAITTSACGSSSGSDSVDYSDRGYSAAWLKVVNAANKEGSVSVNLVFTPEQNDALVKAFNKEFPNIQVQVTKPTNAAAAETQMDQQQQSGKLQYDVASTEQFYVDKVVKDNGAEPIDGPATKSWDAKYYDPGYVPLNMTPVVLTYNTNLVKQAPTSWESLVSSDYKGRVGVKQNSGTPGDVELYTFYNEKLGADYLPSLAKLHPKIYVNSTAVAQAIASGEIAWSAYGLTPADQALKDQGAPIAWTIPTEGSPGLVNYGIAFKSGPHPNAGRVFLDFMMSQEGQKILTAGGLAVSFTDTPGAQKVDLSKTPLPETRYADPAAATASKNQYTSLFGG